MVGFVYTSEHRPDGQRFLDFECCRTDDRTYDEAIGPKSRRPLNGFDVGSSPIDQASGLGDEDFSNGSVDIDFINEAQAQGLIPPLLTNCFAFFSVFVVDAR